MAPPLRLLLELVAPALCAGCGARAGAHEPLCLDCRRGLRRLGPRPVLVGGLPTWAPVAYEGPARALVGALKFRGAAGAARVMAAQVVGNAPAGLLDAPAPAGAVLDWGAISPTSQDSGALALVPVPIHPRRARRRGYNQAALLAAAIAERTGLPVADCLERAGSAGAQVGRGRAARLAGPPGSVRAGDHVPERAVLVDDVVTTGGTLAAAAAALRAAGARHVAAVAFARTPGR